jgi:hypothetical protein
VYATLDATQNPYEVDLGRTTFVPGFCVFSLDKRHVGVSNQAPTAATTQSDDWLLGRAQWPGYGWGAASIA